MEFPPPGVHDDIIPPVPDEGVARRSVLRAAGTLVGLGVAVSAAADHGGTDGPPPTCGGADNFTVSGTDGAVEDWGYGLGDLGAPVEHRVVTWGPGAELDGEPLADDGGLLGGSPF